MFGYINVNQPELKIREYTRYRGYYCGLCTSLRKNYGGSARLALSYDTTFLVMLLSSLYEPGTKERSVRCSMHPTQKHLELSNSFTDYGADMNMLMAWYTAMDHKQDKDDKKTKLKGNSLAVLYKKYFNKLKERYPDKVAAIEASMAEILRLEEENCQELDKMAGLSGDIVAQLFVYKEDEWADELRAIGNLLGRFIFLIDAWEDLPEDMANGCYNVLTDMYKATDSMAVFNEQCHSYMTMFISDCAAHFERLPLIEDAEIMRNILYAGVWNRYYMVLAKREKKEKKTLKNRK